MARPRIPAPHLAPLMGRDVLRERGGVKYHRLETRSLLNRCNSPRMPFQWTVNPYRGCAMGCRYCYAAYTHEFMGIEGSDLFHSTVFAKAGGEAETAHRLSSLVRRGELVALGTATDPYQPGEAEFKVTRRFLELAAQQRGLRLGITTKGALVLRDLDLLRRIHERSRLSVQVSLISPNAELLRLLEPWAPPPEVRLEVLRRLVESGIEAGLSLAPVLPLLTDGEADLDELMGRAAAAGVRRLASNILFLRSPTKEKYLAWLEATFPQHLQAYRRAFTGHVYLKGRYAEWVRARVRRLREKHGFEDAFPREPPAPGPPVQLPLWR